ncbi:MAG: InlB B-repeat-containing protein, partial [Clostridiales bacterium]|nr:InlB B-repeat-containing protein [Clostridiales bacterium]
MKKTRKALAAIAAAVLGTAAFGLAACTNPNLSDPSTGGDTGNNNKPSTPAIFTVTFDANGGEFEGGEETVEVKTKSDGTVEFPTAPEWDDHTFEGYTLNEDGTGGAVTATKVFTEDTTVYALWEEIVENGGDNQGGDNQGGDNQGGDNQGGDNQGGNNQGGDNQGGDNQGGDNQGGDNQGGDNQGGDNQGGNTGTQYPDPVTSKNIKVNGSVRTDVVLVAGNDGAEANVIPDKLQFNYYATDVSLNKDDVLEFVLEGVTIDKIWAKEGTAIVGVNATTGKTINGCEVTVLAGGTYTVSVSQYEDQVANNEVSVYIGPYSGSYDTGSGGNQGGDTTTNANYVLVGTQKYEFGVGNMAGTDHDFYLEDLSLTQGDVLKFYYN